MNSHIENTMIDNQNGPQEQDYPGGHWGLVLLAVTIFLLALMIVGDLLAVLFR